MKHPSIRRALLIRGGIGVSLLLCFLFAAVYGLVKHSFFRELDASITQTAALLANQIEYEEDHITYEWEEGLGSNRALTAEGLFQFWDHRTGSIKRSPALRSHDLPKFSGLDGKPLLRNITLPDGNRGRAIGLRVRPFVLPEAKAVMEARGTFIDPEQMPQTLVVAGNAEPLYQTLQMIQRILAVGVFLTLLLGFLMIQRAIRVSLRPIDELAAEMENRAENQLDAPLDLTGKLPSELIPLAKNFDSVLLRVAMVREREKDFIRHAAHELRTPVAGLRATTDLALSMPRKAADYVGHLASCQKTAIELGELVSRLSALSRIGQTSMPVVLESIDAKLVLMECVERFEPLIIQRGLRINCEIPDDHLMLKGDVALLRLIFNNLLDNALSYACPASELRIRAACTGGKASIRISNRMVGTTEDPERFFEPLFRKDQSRNDSGTHLGIGLTLARSAAISMGAGLVARNAEKDWIEFVLSVPAARGPSLA
jgi:signal transduction histidine kinase